jgi:hypothetical protein
MIYTKVYTYHYTSYVLQRRSAKVTQYFVLFGPVTLHYRTVCWVLGRTSLPDPWTEYHILQWAGVLVVFLSTFLRQYGKTKLIVFSSHFHLISSDSWTAAMLHNLNFGWETDCADYVLLWFYVYLEEFYTASRKLPWPLPSLHSTSPYVIIFTTPTNSIEQPFRKFSVL